MNDIWIATTAFPLLLLLIALRIPIALAMLAIGIIGNLLITQSWSSLSVLKSLPYEIFSSYNLSIIPLFLLMGQLATHSGLSKSLFNTTDILFSRFKGGLAMATMGASAGFGAICGSSLATTTTIGKVALPRLQEKGYSESFSTGLVSAGGTLGILIPPSFILIIYASLSKQNIAKLFAAAILPGLLALVGYLITISVLARWFPHRIIQKSGSTNQTTSVTPPIKLKKITLLIKLFINTWEVALLFCLVIGGIYLGVFTPNEGASVGVVYTALSTLIKKKLNWQNLSQIVTETASITAMIYFLILGASLFNSFLAFSNFPQEVANWMVTFSSPSSLLIIIILVYLLLGCFMDSLSMILLTIPVIYPVISNMNFEFSPDASPESFGIWFGILSLSVVEIGLITPPVGLNLFVVNSIANQRQEKIGINDPKYISINETYKGVFPFLISDLIRIFIIIKFPILSTFLL